VANILEKMGNRAESDQVLRAALKVQEALVADYPSVPAFREYAAWYRTCTGLVSARSGDLAGAARTIRAAQAEMESLLDPKNLGTQLGLFLTLTDMHLGRVLKEAGDVAGSVSEYRKALALARIVAAADPGNLECRGMVASALTKVGLAERDAGRPAQAAAAFREAISILNRDLLITPLRRYALACDHALLSGLSGRPGSGVSAEEGRFEADRAMHWLRDAVTAGFRDHTHISTDTDLVSLRERPDFQLLMLDLAFPANLFAP
jgi:tetratricopeptide (TPR) repeat protein